jgi:phage/plasmid-associated DNA primase
MSTNDNNRKIQITGSANALIRFDKFLKDHKVTDKGVAITHTAFGPPYGKFLIPDEKSDNFFELYCDALQKGCDLHIVERPKKNGPLLIDIDFHFDEKYNERIYKDDDIKYIIGCTNGIIRKYYKYTSETILSFVFEKNSPCSKENKEMGTKEWKDGFHIVYPYISISEGMRYLIIDSIKKKVVDNKGFKHIPFSNTVDEVFDVSVIKHNGWMMYGSRKDNGPRYKLTKIYNCMFEEIDTKKYKHRDLVKILSNRKYNDNDETDFKPDINKTELQKEIIKVLSSYNVMSNDNDKSTNKNKKNNKDTFIDEDENIEYEYSEQTTDKEVVIETVESIRAELLNKRKEQNKQTEKKNKGKEINLAKKLINLMSRERATKYDSWIKVGWALHNISSNLLDTFKEFSKKAGKSYNEKSCEKIWDSARDTGLTIGSLRHWAKLDSPDDYDELLTECINELILEAESGTEYDIAKVVHELYKEQYKCTSINHNVWYEFQNNLWVEVEAGYTLSTKISEELTKEFALLNTTYMKQMGDKNKKGSDKDNLLSKATSVLKIMNNLKKSGFKDRVIKECKIMFFEPQFEEKLDSNRNLIGFNNGVYDLEAGLFRDGTPDDLVSLTVGYDYEEYHNDHEYVIGIKDYFSKVQREEIMREYILTLMASYLDGHTKKEQFVLWTGSGCHAAGTNIRMYNETLKKVEDISIGDKLMGDDYKPRIVKHLYRGRDKMYKINQEIGQSYIINLGHRLALKFVGDNNIIFNNDTKLYEITWYESDENSGISKKMKNYDENQRNNSYEFYNNLDNNENLIKKNHLVIIPLSAYLKLENDIKNLLYGFKNEIEINDNDTIVKLNLYQINVEYVGEDEYYGFELSNNQRYLLEDGTVTANSNGKSKTVELFQLAFGDYCGVLPITVLTRKRGGSGQATPELAEMRGKRFVVFQEPENNDEIQVGFMKELTGGDWIYARPLFRDPIKYKPQFKLLLTCNKLPFIPSTDGGTWRRLRVSPWESEFVDDPKLAHQFKKDYELLEKLELWKKAFVWLLLKVYYPIFKNNGLKEPAKVTQFTNKYKKQSDIFYEFIDSTLTLTKDNKDCESHDTIYYSLKQWYNESYSGKCPYAKKDLIEYLSNNNYTVDKSYFYGIIFKSEEKTNSRQKLDN